MSVSPCARWWCVDSAGIQATRLAGTIHVPRSVCTDRTPLAAYTKCPCGWECARLAPPDGHRCTPPDGQVRDWRATGIPWHSTGRRPCPCVTTVQGMRTTMRAAVCVRAGGPEVLEIRELPVPTVKKGWSLVRVMGAGLNRSELRTRQGHS